MSGMGTTVPNKFTALFFHLDEIATTAGLLITIFVLAILNSPFFSAAVISATDFNILGVALAFHFTKFT
jgi:hypothetical protein